MNKAIQRILVIGLVVTTSFSLVGCGTKNTETVPEDTAAQVAVEEQDAQNQDVKEEQADQELEKNYTFDQLSVAMAYNEEHEIDANGAMSISYLEQYGEICFAIPDEIDHNRIQKIVCNVDGAELKGLAVKMLKSETCYEDSEQIAVAYETNMVERASDLTSAANNVGIMGLLAGYSVKLESITFYLNEATVVTQTVKKDIPSLKDNVCERMGEDFIVGAVLSSTTVSDENICDLVKQHFNAVTLENELKPDSILNNSSSVCKSTETVTLNGEELLVPKLSFAASEMILNQILAWNEENPENAIKVRGHVLVWHSQTPEWFFHEEYNASKPYVTKEEMAKRQEWYIKSVLEHFTGTESKYKDLFYGWDVVNEAVSDATGTYRNDSENSSWWAVYQSNAYVTDAFVFANKYAPDSLELYYNDYNECVSNKVKGICQLLTDVKATPGARISGFGMQGHHSTEGSPTISEFKNAAKAYTEIVDYLQLTEFDLKASKSFDGTEEGMQAEYTKEAYRYKDFYDAIYELGEEGVRFTGWTVWGTIDRYSWLQSASNVGGASDGQTKQCPLLFDDNYQAKPAYWAFVDEHRLEPNIQSVIVNEAPSKDFSTGKEYDFEKGDTKASFIPVWEASAGMLLTINVVDKTEDESDEVSVYTVIDGKITQQSVMRKDAKATVAGYQAELSVPISDAAMQGGEDVLFDVVITNGKDKLAFNDSTLSQDTDSKYYAIAQIRPYMMIQKGSATVDGDMDAAFEKASEIPLHMRLGAKAESTVRLLWDEEYLYAFVTVKDSVLNNANENEYERDSFEIFLDENNHKSAEYEEDDKQYRIDFVNNTSFNGENCLESNMESVAKETEDGYIVEAKFKWTQLKPEAGNLIGIDLQINDADSTGSRIGTVNWYDLTGQGWSSPAVFGEAKLTE